MKNIFKEAVIEYVNSLETDVKDCKINPHTGYVSKIEIKGDFNFDIYAVIPKSKLDYIAEFWFGDSDDYDVEDLTKEIINLIVGNAKVIAKNRDITFNISTPEFLGKYDKIEYDDLIKFKFRNSCFYLLFKEK